MSYTKGSWQDNMSKAAGLFEKTAKDKKRASSLLWDGAVDAINEWLPQSKSDPSAEDLAAEMLGVMGESRKGDVSKIRTVAIAVREKGLSLDEQPNLSRAYAEARRLTTVAVEEAEEDDAAEEAVSNIEAPKTATTAAASARLLLSKGVDEAVDALLDALGSDNIPAQRAFMRAVAAGVAARTQEAAEELKAAKKAALDKARAEKKEAAAKAKAEKAAKAKADKAAKAKGKPAKGKPAKAKAEPEPEEIEEDETDPEEMDDLDALFEADPEIDDEIEDEIEDDEVEEIPAPAPAKKGKGRPIRRRK